MSEPNAHPTEDALQDWLDGELSGEDADGVADHVSACAVCRTQAERTRGLLASLHDLPREMRAPEEILAGAHRRLPASRVVPLDPEGRTPKGVRRTGLAAAAVALLIVGAIAGALLAPGGDRIAPDPGAPSPATTSAGDLMAVEYDPAVERLTSALEARRDELDPATVRIVEESLVVIDRAIREAREALAADPANPVLRELVVAGYEQKLDLLRRATRPTETL